MLGPFAGLHLAFEGSRESLRSLTTSRDGSSWRCEPSRGACCLIVPCERDHEGAFVSPKVTWDSRGGDEPVGLAEECSHGSR